MRFKNFMGLLSLVLCLAVQNPVFSQVYNQSSSKVDNLTDDQIRGFIKQFEATGLPESQLEQVALAKGYSPADIQKLRLRVNAVRASGMGKTTAIPENNNRSNSGLSIRPDTMQNHSAEDKAETKSKIFGADLFKNSSLTFEPNLRIPTPKNYVIGQDDEILIDITGDNEASYKLKVTPEGTIRIEYAGIIAVNGITVEQATAKIQSRLAQTYPAIRSGRTKVTIGIGNIRSIKVTLLGQVVKPGSYTLPSLATVFNALYASGGPTTNGSFRQIELIRNNRVIATLDVYDFLIRGYQKNNIRLQDQDVIRVPTYKVHAEIDGEVKIPAIFEVLPGEHLSDVLSFAGGFTDLAYTARVKILQKTSTERRITDVAAANYSLYVPNNGDKYFVEPILERFENRVVIQGAVFRPGQFELQPGLTVSQLIKKAEGVTEDAFLSRAYITRLKADNSVQLISFDPGKILNGTTPDIALQREDVVSISSIFDLREEYNVSIDGEVRQPGIFKYAENMSLEDLLLQAGGFKEGASAARIEISRRVKNSDITSTSAKTAEIFQVDVDKDFKFKTQNFILQPFDIVSVRNSTGYEIQRQVRVEGEVQYPGTYSISSKNERISDLVRRAGGLTPLAYPEGASLKRESGETGSGKNKINANKQEQLSKIQHLQSGVADSVKISDITTLRNSFVGIRLDKILIKPSSKQDLLVEEGDVLSVPKQLQTVKVSGEVLFPVTTIYTSSKGFRQYISSGGGYSEKALKKRAYVIYANGSVESTRKVFIFNNYPIIKPGAEIFVPTKAERRRLSTGETIGLASAIGSLGAVAYGIINSLSK